MIQTGIQKLDELLDGGIRHGIITDIFGASATGKTQLALQICINALKNDVEILYQDTTGGFRPERMLTLIKTKNMDPKLLDHVRVGRITNTSEQISYLEKTSEIKNLGLIVIDNVTDLFSFEYSKESSLLEKHVVFMEYMHNLAFIAVTKKIRRRVRETPSLKMIRLMSSLRNSPCVLMSCRSSPPMALPIAGTSICCCQWFSHP